MGLCGSTPATEAPKNEPQTQAVDEEKAAVKIQSLARGKKARKRVAAIKADKEEKAKKAEEPAPKKKKKGLAGMMGKKILSAHKDGKLEAAVDKMEKDMEEEEKKQQSTLYVINPFYMDMRAQYVAPGAEIQYYLCEFENDVLSFEDFRQKVIGATDPVKAAPGTLRANALKDYQALNLPQEPYTSFNVVHGSASPLEAMAERLNWCGLEVGQDAFGAALLQAGVSEATIKEWSRDATVTHNGKATSIFDLMEEKNAQEVLEIARAIVGASDGAAPSFTTNSAFVFIKPGATTPETLAMVSKTLTDAKITIAGEGTLKAQVIDEKKLIDNHYYAIANKAVLSHPKTIQITPEAKEKFQKAFNAEWDDVLGKDILVNARELCDRRNMEPAELSTRFRALAPENSVKLGGGFYVAKMEFA